MRVVHLSTMTGDIGGAARASYRLHASLRSRGAESTVLALYSNTNDPDVHVLGRGQCRRRERVRREIGYRFERTVQRYARPVPGAVWTSGLVAPLRIEDHPAVRKADVLILYWVGGGFLSTGRIGRLLALGKPVVWRLSDMWAFTGGCHYSAGCERYQQACGRCPQLRSRNDYDLSRLVWHAKRRAWATRMLTVVCPSTWMARCARGSSLLQGADVRIIHTGVDVDQYRPHDRAAARKKLGLPANRPIVLIGGHDIIVGNERKGGKHLLDALVRVRKTVPEVHLAIFGTSYRPDGIDSTAFGVVKDEQILAQAYSAADVFVSTSTEDNLPNTVLEAMACGVPVVAFGIQGVRDAVEHGRTGLLTRPLDIDDLAGSITELLRDDTVRRNMGSEGRRAVLERFNSARQAGEYAALLEHLCYNSPALAARSASPE